MSEHIPANSALCFRFSYNPREYYEKIPEAKKAIDQILEGYFTPSEENVFNHLIIKHLLDHDR